MSTKLGSLWKWLPTPFARKWLLSSMRAHVIIQGGRSTKRSQAVPAFEGLLAHVNNCMHTQLFWLSKRFMTMATSVGLTRHARTKMIVQKRTLSEGHFTLTTFEIITLPEVLQNFLVYFAVSSSQLNSCGGYRVVFCRWHTIAWFLLPSRPLERSFCFLKEWFVHQPLTRRGAVVNIRLAAPCLMVSFVTDIIRRGFLFRLWLRTWNSDAVSMLRAWCFSFEI